MCEKTNGEYMGICDMLRSYAQDENTRLHMPGHGGVGIMDLSYEYDVTENARTDNLYDPSDGGYVDSTLRMIEQTYGSTASIISAHGATAAIQSSVYCCRVLKGKRFFVHRKCHASVINALTMCDCEMTYFTDITHLDFMLDHPCDATVILTSPDYYGDIEPVSKYSDLCKKYGAYLIVDNSHGAHLLWCKDNMHPLTLGADFCIDSMHKTTPTLTGGALLHSVKCKRDLMLKGVRLFASTSPSYLIAASVEKSVQLMNDKGKELLLRLESEISDIEDPLKSIGFCRYKSELYDPCRLTVESQCHNGKYYDMTKVCDYLAENGVVAEFASKDKCVFIVPVFTKRSDLQKLLTVLESFTKKYKPDCDNKFCNVFPIPKRSIGIRRALLSRSEKMPLDIAIGKVSAEIKYVYPPGIPIVLPGDVIDEKTALILAENKITDIEVVSDEEG
ncbi:MAG: aminotransferase class I/II-fold pyridoxal phosphate-dependent enzyme [Clostridia bacterium]|nr:aminotransferase class I/II-fold pyridoxal phosphate-dependent enzyme [Clostridia bacterium]